MATKTNFNPILIVPGMLFWVLIAVGAVTKNYVLIGIAVGCAVLTIIVGLTLKVRRFNAARVEAGRIWASGTPATARVIKLTAAGGSLNRNPFVDLELEVTNGTAPPYIATTHVLISSLAIPRVQPECKINVRVDPQDATKVLVDPDLTVMGYGPPQ